MSSGTGLPDPLIGTVIAERYRVDSLLGEGGMGKVYGAEHVLMQKRLAIKVLHPELCTIADVVARFEREVRASANIDHPNVAAATDSGKLPDGSLYLVLELVDGLNLRDEIAAGPLPVKRALRIVRQIADALSAAHALGIVHRDLKPENVMLIRRRDETDVVKVLDFGIAKLPATTGGSGPVTRIGTVFGTPEYMAPEQALGQPVEGTADLYALGVIAYEMLVGTRPFAGANATAILGLQLSKDVPPFAERAPGLAIPRAVEALVQRLLEREASNRFASAGEVMAAIEALQELPDEPPAPASPVTALLGTAPRFDGSFPALGPASAGPGGAPAPRSSDGELAVATPHANGAAALERRRLLTFALLGGGAFVTLIALGLTVAWMMSSRPTPRGAAARPSASALALGGAPSASALSLGGAPPSAAPSDDAASLLARAAKESAGGEHAQALTSLERALTTDPKLADAPAASAVLAAALRQTKSANAAFTLLEQRMGAPGAAVAYDLAVDLSAPAAQRGRAERWVVLSKAFLATASPAVKLSAQLRYASNCAGRLQLMPRAAELGDARVLAALKSLRTPTGCGPSRRLDCYPCLRKDDTLERTIAAVSARLAE
ncbi:MAG: protein kinase [Sorangiineae bacterium]|nr:protein kinase [Polyangiaceae bacterium]MEB2321959.1 protein kinase [Sorangiineae bacterium]